MRRILLVIDDFNEMVGLETLFRRLGFDVLSVSRDSLVAEAVLGFPPDLALATGQGRYVNGLRLAPKLKSGPTQPKLVVLLPINDDQDAGDNPALATADVDAIIKTPFEPRSALRIVARLLSLDVDPILEKYQKILNANLFEPDQLKIVKHAKAPPVSFRDGLPPPAVPTARESRYAKFLEDKAEEELPPIASHDALRDARKKLEESDRNASIDQAQAAAKLAREKREFVRAMIETVQADEPESGEESVERKITK